MRQLDLVPRFTKNSIAFVAAGLFAQSINFYFVQKNGTVFCVKGAADPHYFINYRRDFLSLLGHAPEIGKFDPFAAAFVEDPVLARATYEQIFKSGYACTPAPANPD